jgi:hypothetical protein
MGTLALICTAGSATAADWQALNGVTATPMTPAQMESVQGKASIYDFFSNLNGGYNSLTLGNGAQILSWASQTGTTFGASGAINNGGTPFGFSTGLTYSPNP